MDSSEACTAVASALAPALTFVYQQPGEKSVETEQTEKTVEQIVPHMNVAEQSLNFQLGVQQEPQQPTAPNTNDNADFSWQSSASSNSNGNHYFIDAASLFDESELIPPVRLVQVIDMSLPETREQTRSSVDVEFQTQLETRFHSPTKDRSQKKADHTDLPAQLRDSFGADLQVVPSSSVPTDSPSPSRQSEECHPPQIDAEVPLHQVCHIEQINPNLVSLPADVLPSRQDPDLSCQQESCLPLKEVTTDLVKETPCSVQLEPKILSHLDKSQQLNADPGLGLQQGPTCTSEQDPSPSTQGPSLPFKEDPTLPLIEDPCPILKQYPCLPSQSESCISSRPDPSQKEDPCVPLNDDPCIPLQHSRTSEDVSNGSNSAPGPLIRRNTFELDPDDERLALLRQEYERRQGNLLFRDCITQFSTHSFQPPDLDTCNVVLGLEPSLVTLDGDQLLTLNPCVVVEESGACSMGLVPKQSTTVGEGSADETLLIDLLEPISLTDATKEDDLIKVVSLIELANAHKQKRSESTPIVSGGVSSLDFSVTKHTESPIMSRRKNEAAPILSGAAPAEMEEPVSVARKPVATAVWVVDMGDCVRRKSDASSPRSTNHSPKVGPPKSGCGFFVDLGQVESPVQPEKPTVEVSEESSEKKPALFSMFIDIGDPKTKRVSASPQLSMHRKAKSPPAKEPDLVNQTDEAKADFSSSSRRHRRAHSFSSSASLSNHQSSDATSATAPSDLSSRLVSSSLTSRSLTSRANDKPASERDDVSFYSDTISEGRLVTEEESHTDVEVDPMVDLSFSSSVREEKPVATVEPEVVTELEEKLDDAQAGFVKLSDLDKEVKDATNHTIPVFPSTNRMSRSIPESSWIESRSKTMSRSVGGASRSLSRLFPHLNSSMTRSRSPDDQSEQSDLSSLQSSMAASGMEGSTEETDTSASRNGPSSRLGEDLLRMFLEEISPDVTVDVGGRRIKAHKCILSSRCQYFAAVLSGGWVQSAGDVISLQGFSYNCVFFTLCHIYSGASTIPDSISIVELATLADMLALEGLKEVISFTLKAKYCHFFHKPCSMCAVGVLECLPLAAAYGLDDIYRKALRWIAKHFVRVWPTKGFATLPRELLDKCFQHHLVHMSPENVLETVMSCDKLLATLPNVRWAEPVFTISSQLLEAAIKFTAHHMSSVLSSKSFTSLGKELSWNISRLEESLLQAADRLPPDEACLSYNKLHHMSTQLQDQLAVPSYVELVRRLESHCEASLLRQAPRCARTASWWLMDVALRARIQHVACIAVLPPDEARTSRNSSPAKHTRSTPGSRTLDLRQVKLAMTQQARRVASGGRVITLIADTKPTKKSQPIAVIHPHRVKLSAEDSDSNREMDIKSGHREIPSKHRSNLDKTPTLRRKMISSSDSSRTSSPAANHRAIGRSQLAAVENNNISKLIEGSELAMSTDSLTENTAVRPDTPSVRRKADAKPGPTRAVLPKTATKQQLGRQGAMSTDSLATVASEDAAAAKKEVKSPAGRRAPLISPRDSNTSRLRAAQAAITTSKKPVAAVANNKKPVAVMANRKPTTMVTANKKSAAPALTSRKPAASTMSNKKADVLSPRPRAKLDTPTKARGTELDKTSPLASKHVTRQNPPAKDTVGATTDDEPPPPIKQLGSRSGTFLKDEPTMLKIPIVDNFLE